jgi:hypothetical protein
MFFWKCGSNPTSVIVSYIGMVKSDAFQVGGGGFLTRSFLRDHARSLAKDILGDDKYTKPGTVLRYDDRRVFLGSML